MSCKDGFQMSDDIARSGRREFGNLDEARVASSPPLRGKFPFSIRKGPKRSSAKDDQERLT